MANETNIRTEDIFEDLLARRLDHMRTELIYLFSQDGVDVYECEKIFSDHVESFSHDIKHLIYPYQVAADQENFDRGPMTDAA